jgi:hypothetical protein
MSVEATEGTFKSLDFRISEMDFSTQTEIPPAPGFSVEVHGDVATALNFCPQVREMLART